MTVDIMLLEKHTINARSCISILNDASSQASTSSGKAMQSHHLQQQDIWYSNLMVRKIIFKLVWIEKDKEVSICQ